MAKITKRIIEAQRDNVNVSDLNISLRNTGDRIDLLARDSLGRQIRSFEQVTKSRDLDTLLEDGSLFIYDENGNRIIGLNPIKSTKLEAARRSSETSIKGGTATYVVGDGLKLDPGDVLKVNFDDNGESNQPSRSDHTHLSNEIIDFEDRISKLFTDNQYISWVYDDSAGTIVGTANLSQFTTDDLLEGSNLYFTDERVDDRVNNLLVAGTNITLVYDDGANTLTINSTASGGSSSFTGLSDTPANYTSSAGYLVRVNSIPDALEFVDGTTLFAATSHTHSSSEITDFAEGVDDRVAVLLAEGAAINLTYNDVAGTLTIDVDDTEIDHTNLLNIGTNTHAQIDAHISSVTNPHSTSDANLIVSDIGTNNVSTLAHGFAPKLSGINTQFLNGNGNWVTPVAGTANAYISQFFNSTTSVNVVHSFGAYPLVQVIVGGSVYIPFSITHNSLNDFTVNFTSNSTGFVIATLGSPQLNNYTVIGGNYTLTNDDYIVEANTSLITVTLPSATTNVSKSFVIKNSSTADIFIDTTGSEKIDNESEISLRPFESVSVYSNGTNYKIF